MSIPPESIEPGRCYLTQAGHVRRVVRIKPNGRVQFMYRPGDALKNWRVGGDMRRSFAAVALREIPCDWTSETNEA
jgi:hypothetical protein